METISSYHTAETKKIPAIATQAGIVEDLEQRRRLMDLEGEGHRICMASMTSEILKSTTHELKHVPYPTSAPLDAKSAEVTFTSQGVAILNAVQGALDVASTFAEDTYHKTTEAASELGHKTAETASAFSHKTAELASSFSHGAVDLASRTVDLATSFGERTAEAASGAASAIGHKTADLAAKSVDLAASLGEKTAEVAIVVGEKTASAASVVSHKTAEVAAVVGEKTSEAAGAAAVAAEKTFAVASDLGHKTAEVAWPKAAELAHVVSQKTAVVAATVIPLAQDLAQEAKSRLVHLADDISYSTTKAYVTAVMEAERRRRMLDVNEQYAILNALAVSNLFKALAPEFYRQSDYCYAYSFKLLEELERKWRLLPANIEIARANAHSITKLVENRCFPIAHVERMYTTGKIEIVEDVPFKQVKHDFTGTPTL